VDFHHLREELAFIRYGIERARQFRHRRDFRFAIALRKGGLAARAEQVASVSKTHAIEPLHELDRVARLPAVASHAAEKSLPRRHDEIRGFLVIVEGAKPRPVASLLFEGRPSRLDERDEVSFGFDSVEFGFGNSGHLFGSGLEPKDLPRYRRSRSAGPIGSRFD
jgi:hypothetical protein